MIRESIGISACFVHANTMSAGYDGKHSFAEGYFSRHPKISTGAGDHFNGGLLSEYTKTFDLTAALHSGSAAAKYYVENAAPPNTIQIQQMRLA
ncbi:MAG: PfkB family carbohydrate kinase [Puniceicoccales bacterium]|jgi:sugar/nucleoside kinase (ribokinase family)|nr:PfkB family carbohydrate kinase [Puniceicoccales bacterium]